VVDEVLAVGDAEFQKRCLGKMSELGSSGRTVVFVSHDLGAVGRLCQRAVWLEHGRIRRQGATSDVVSAYRGENVGGALGAELAQDPNAPVAVTRVELLDGAGRPLPQLRRAEDLIVRLTVEVRGPQLNTDLALWITDAAGVRILDEAMLDEPGAGGRLDAPGTYEVDFSVPALLPPGDHVLGLWIGTQAGQITDGEILHLDVLPLPTDRDELLRRARMASPAVRWDVRAVAPSGAADVGR
jgi:hypothetical protein